MTMTPIPTTHGVLYIVATPIGNLLDITQRALATLRTVDIIAAEDTRHSQKLLAHYQITTPCLSLHGFNEAKRSTALLARLTAGQNIALISDAGTPLISDPGARLVQLVRAQGIQVAPIPGPCALVAALCAAGLSTEQFLFVGFLPAKATARQRQLNALRQQTTTLIFYESPHRIVALCQDIAAILGGDRPMVLAKEMTKLFETFFSGSASEVCAWLLADAMHQKGEFVVLVSGAPDTSSNVSAEAEQVLRTLLAELPVKRAVTIAAQITGVAKNVLYALALEQRRNTP